MESVGFVKNGKHWPSYGGFEMILSLSTEFSIDKVKDFIARNNWIYAKTMPWAPHFYICKHYLKDAEKTVYEKLFFYIQDHGEKRKWGKSIRVYLDVDEWRYWLMTDDVAVSKIINRELIVNSRAVKI